VVRCTSFSFAKEIVDMKALLLLIVGLLLSPLPAFAASMSVSPASVSTQVGQTVSVSIVSDTQGKALNQGEAVLSFPKDMLEAVSASRTGSVFTLWVTEPTISNTAGTITFNGGAPTPGFTSSKATLTTITFKAKKTGTATLSLSGAALRANDGFGTDVLSGTSGGSVTITEASIPKAIPAPKPKPKTEETTPTPAPAEPLEVTASVDYDSKTGTIVVSNISTSGTTSPVTTYELAVDGGAFEEITPTQGGMLLQDIGENSNPGIHTLVLRISYATGEFALISQTFTVPEPIDQQSLGQLFGVTITLSWFIPFVIAILLLSLLATTISMLALKSNGKQGNLRLQKRNIMLHRTLYEYKESLEKHLRAIQLAGTLRELTPEELVMHQAFVHEIDILEKRLASELKKYD
jgi:hypothetical protein